LEWNSGYVEKGMSKKNLTQNLDFKLTEYKKAICHKIPRCIYGEIGSQRKMRDKVYLRSREEGRGGRKEDRHGLIEAPKEKENSSSKQGRKFLSKKEVIIKGTIGTNRLPVCHGEENVTVPSHFTLPNQINSSTNYKTRPYQTIKISFIKQEIEPKKNFPFSAKTKSIKKFAPRNLFDSSIFTTISYDWFEVYRKMQKKSDNFRIMKKTQNETRLKLTQITQIDALAEI